MGEGGREGGFLGEGGREGGLVGEGGRGEEGSWGRVVGGRRVSGGGW